METQIINFIRITANYSELDKLTNEFPQVNNLKNMLIINIEVAIKFFEGMIKIKQRQTNINYPLSNPCNIKSLKESSSPYIIQNSDLHIHAIYINDEEQQQSVFATSCLFDSRPIFGIVEFNIAQIMKKNIISKENIELFQKDIIHQFIHLLGFSSNLYKQWINKETGSTYDINTILTIDNTIRGKSIQLLSSPQVLETTKSYYNCPNITGMQLENSDSQENGEHWEATILNNELMTNQQSNKDTKFSKFTIALLKDTGFYDEVLDINQETINWGNGQGCYFFSYNCDNQQTNIFQEYCQNLYDTFCSFEKTSIATCKLSNLFDNNCSYKSITNSCQNVNNQGLFSSDKLMSFTDKSKCFFSNLTNLTNIYDIVGPRCYQYECNLDVITIIVQGNNFICKNPGHVFYVDQTSLKGIIQCPIDIKPYCSIKNNCLNNCNNNGYCSNGQCFCKKNFSGLDCSINCPIYSQQNICIVECDIGYYLHSPSKTCLLCYEQCSSCNGPGQYNCTGCKTGYLLNGVCLSICPYEYMTNAITKVCAKKCDQNSYLDLTTNSCKFCLNPCNSCLSGQQDDCTTCINNYYFQKGSCLSQCPTGFQNNNVNNQCTFQCKQNQYFNSTNQLCLDCSINCESCQEFNSISITNQNIPRCYQCVNGYHVNPFTGYCEFNIRNCSLYNITNYPQCIQCNLGYYLNKFGTYCIKEIDGCLLYQDDYLLICQKCKDGYVLTKNGTECQTQCLISGCIQCNSYQICQKCSQNLVLNENGLNCDQKCQNSSNLYNCKECTQNECTQCLNQFYLEQGSCKNCLTLFSNCLNCTKNTCVQCINGYYFNQTYNYCLQCSTSLLGCIICEMNNNILQCLECERNRFYLINNQCTNCNSVTEGCQECIVYNNQPQCFLCQDKYFLNINNQCKLCNQKLNNCAQCSYDNTNQLICNSCQQNFYAEFGKCRPCSSTCLTCYNYQPQSCLSCQIQYIYHSNQCLQDSSLININLISDIKTIMGFFNFQVKQIAAFQLDYQESTFGNICVSNIDCNSNGKCLKTICNCFNGYFGYKCQFKTNQTQQLTNLLNQIIQKLQLQLINQVSSSCNTMSYENIFYLLKNLQSISEFTLIMNLNSINQLKNIFTKCVQSNKNILLQEVNGILFTILGNLMSPINSNDNLSSIEKRQVSQDLFDLLNQIQDIIMENQLSNNNITIISRNIYLNILQIDVKNSYSYINLLQENFKKQRILSNIEQCNNLLILNSSIIYYNQVFINKLIENQLNNEIHQIKIVNKIILVDSHYSYNQIDSSVVEIQIFNFTGHQIEVQLNSSESSIIVYIPKKDQSDTSQFSKIKCLQWSASKKTWIDQGVDNTKSSSCKYYGICFIKQAGEYGFQFIDNENLSSQQTGSSQIIAGDLIVKNSGFAIPIGIFIFFLLMVSCCTWVPKCVPQNIPKRKIQIPSIPTNPIEIQSPDQLDTDNAQPNQYINNIDLQAIQTQVQEEIQINAWMILHIYSLAHTTNLGKRLQKISLICANLLYYVTAASLLIGNKEDSIRMYILYTFLPIFVAWIMNYIWGSFALLMRWEDHGSQSINPIYWVMFIAMFAGFSILSTWGLYGESVEQDNACIVAFFVDVFLDFFCFDIFIVFISSSGLNENKQIFLKIANFFKYKGFYED